ncbi:MAG: amidohydrolase family protein, partial [Actinomycetota bacterium]
MTTYDLVIRGGSVIDGTGSPAFAADVAVIGSTIAEVGRVRERGRVEIDADGAVVAPGFVDIHGHYDGQATWDSRMQPSSWHGVTTVLSGNCGVGFAPVRPRDRERLIELMEGVEDIPGVVLREGLDWSWESFPEYLSKLESRQLDLDVAAMIPHVPLRVFVMGERAIAKQLAIESDIALMAQ